MNYKEEDKKYVEAGGRVSYYDFTEKEIARVVKTNVKEVEAIDWRMLIQMLYPTNMIGSGLFQPILIFRIGRNGKRIDPPIEAYNSLDDMRKGDCLLFRIIDHIEKNSNLKIDDSWYELRKKILEAGESNEK